MPVALGKPPSERVGIWKEEAMFSVPLGAGASGMRLPMLFFTVPLVGILKIIGWVGVGAATWSGLTCAEKYKKKKKNRKTIHKVKNFKIKRTIEELYLVVEGLFFSVLWVAL